MSCAMRLHDRDVIGELREEEPLLEAAVAATDDREVLRAPVERSIARRAEVDAGTDEVGFALGVGASIGRARRDRAPTGARTSSPVERLTRIIGPSRTIGRRADGLEDLDAVALRLLGHALGQLRAADTVGEAGIVVESLGDPGLTAGRGLLDDEHLARSRARRRSTS